MLLLWLLVCLLSLVKSFDSDCTLELEDVLKKPVACGAAYFERLSKELQLQLGCQRPTAAFCAGLVVLNPSGRYLCSNANNPTAALYFEIFAKLNMRSADNRFAFYLNYNTTEIPGPESVDMDSYGILAFTQYFGVQAQAMNPDFTALWGLFEQANAYLNALPALPAASNQEDVVNFENVADIVIHTDQYNFQQISFAIQKLLGRQDIRTYPSVLSTVMLFSEMASKVLLPDGETPTTPQERSLIYRAIVNELNFLLQMARRTFSWTFPLPMSQLESGQCEYAYTYFDALGAAFRIMLNQPLEAVLYKK